MTEGKFFEKKADTKKEEQILSQILGYENPKRQEYEELIKRESQTPRQDAIDYSVHWNAFFHPSSIFPEGAVEYMKRKLKGKMLIDLCGGSRMFKPYVIPRIAAASGCKVYIDVDVLAYNLDKIKTDLDGIVADENNLAGFCVKSDALDFVSKIKEGEIVFSINGVDEDIIQDEEYRKALAQEISRVVPSGGIVFGFNCELPLEEFGFKLISEDFGIKIRSFDATFHQIFEKI